jgi:hypothetical protein
VIQNRSCEVQRERVSADACTVYFPNREGSAGILPANGEDARPKAAGTAALPQPRFSQASCRAILNPSKWEKHHEYGRYLEKPEDA